MTRCRRQVSITAGTAFHHARLPLPKGFAAIYLTSVGRGGISALRLSKLLGVSWRSAYRMLRVLRRRADRDRCYWLTGLVEVDDALATLGSLAERHNHTPRVTPPDQANEWPPKVHLVIANLKRFILGTVHGVSGQYLRDYIDDDSIAVVGKLNAHNG